MSLFGTSPPGESALIGSPASRSRGLFDDDDSSRPSKSSTSLFADDNGDDDSNGNNNGSRSGSPWDMPTPRRRQSRADLVKTLLRPADVPESYVDLFDRTLEEDEEGGLGKISRRGLARLFAAGRISSEQRDRILGIVSPGGGDVGRNEFNVLLALVGLAQEGETLSLDTVDERKRGEQARRYRSFLSCYIFFRSSVAHFFPSDPLLVFPIPIPIYSFFFQLLFFWSFGCHFACRMPMHWSGSRGSLLDGLARFLPCFSPRPSIIHHQFPPT